MRVELDHVFVLTSAGAPEADRLIQFGLTEGPPNTHPGQGTACRRFLFRNGFLELVWVADPAEAQGSLVRRTRLWERWSGRGRGASPIGVCVRPASPGAPVPFAAWEYRPPYLPEPLAIFMGANSEVVAEPLLFFADFHRLPDSGAPSWREPPAHPAGFQVITLVRVHTPLTGPASAELRALEQACPCLNFVSGSEDLMEVGFDGEAQGRSADFRPTLPLMLRW
jgi:hypothetical protein